MGIALFLSTFSLIFCGGFCLKLGHCSLDMVVNVSCALKVGGARFNLTNAVCHFFSGVDGVLNKGYRVLASLGVRV